MNHTDFDWDFENITHIARHGVTPEEAEEVFDHVMVLLRMQTADGEERYIEVGHTDGGRMLEVVSTPRNGRTRLITVYKPSKASLTAYHLAVGGAF